MPLKTNYEFSRRMPTRKLGWTDAGGMAAAYGIFPSAERKRGCAVGLEGEYGAERVELWGGWKVLNKAGEAAAAEWMG
jgi:hypothetical protein